MNLSALSVYSGFSSPNMENVEVFQVTFVEGYVSITLDYDFYNPPDRVNNETLLVFILFTGPSNDGTTSIEAAILFFHTNYGESFYFWTKDDPFNLASLWLQNSEFESYTVDTSELTLIPVECLVTSDLNLEITVLARIVKLNAIDPSSFEVQQILSLFYEELDIEIPITTSPSTTSSSHQTHLSSTTLGTSTSTTESQLTPGFEFFITMSILIIVTIFTIRKKQETKK